MSSSALASDRRNVLVQVWDSNRGTPVGIIALRRRSVRLPGHRLAGESGR
jgi:hypothetical protein